MSIDYALEFPREVRRNVPAEKLAVLVGYMSLAEFAVAEVRKSNPDMPIDTILAKYEVRVSQTRPDGTTQQVPMTIGQLVSQAQSLRPLREHCAVPREHCRQAVRLLREDQLSDSKRSRGVAAVPVAWRRQRSGSRDVVSLPGGSGHRRSPDRRAKGALVRTEGSGRAALGKPDRPEASDVESDHQDAGIRRRHRSAAGYAVHEAARSRFGPFREPCAVEHHRAVQDLDVCHRDVRAVERADRCRCLKRPRGRCSIEDAAWNQSRINLSPMFAFAPGRRRSRAPKRPMAVQHAWPRCDSTSLAR